MHIDKIMNVVNRIQGCSLHARFVSTQKHPLALLHVSMASFYSDYKNLRQIQSPRDTVDSIIFEFLRKQ